MLCTTYSDHLSSPGAFGSKDEFQSLENDLSAMERSRRAFADRMDSLATAKEAELARLRTDLHNAQAAVPVVPPKKTIVDDTEPAKKTAPKKKPAPKKPSTTTPPPAPPPQ